MTSAPSMSQRITRSAFSSVTVVVSAFLLLWIALSGLVAVARNPYLVMAYWFLGIAGLFSCVGAFLEATRGKGDEGEVPRPFRTVACLGGAAMVGFIFWSQARPVLDGPGAELAMLGVVLAMAAVIGTGGLLFLSILLFSRREEEGESPAEELKSRQRSGERVSAEGLVA